MMDIKFMKIRIIPLSNYTLSLRFLIGQTVEINLIVANYLGKKTKLPVST